MKVQLLFHDWPPQGLQAYLSIPPFYRQHMQGLTGPRDSVVEDVLHPSLSAFLMDEQALWTQLVKMLPLLLWQASTGQDRAVPGRQAGKTTCSSSTDGVNTAGHALWCETIYAVTPLYHGWPAQGQLCPGVPNRTSCDPLFCG